MPSSGLATTRPCPFCAGGPRAGCRTLGWVSQHIVEGQNHLPCRAGCFGCSPGWGWRWLVRTKGDGSTYRKFERIRDSYRRTGLSGRLAWLQNRNWGLNRDEWAANGVYFSEVSWWSFSRKGPSLPMIWKLRLFPALSKGVPFSHNMSHKTALSLHSQSLDGQQESGNRN